MDYYSKYLKYKNKYLELKKSLYGGVNQLGIMYANVGVDSYGLPGAFCNQRLTDLTTSQLTLENLKHAFNLFTGENKDILLFSEFCFSELHNLILFLNERDRENIYGLVLLAQKRDNSVYSTSVDEREGRIKSGKVMISGYHPDAFGNHPDGYFKCFGYIYKTNILNFNVEQTQHNIRDNIIIQKLISINPDHIYTDGLITRTEIPIRDRLVYILKIYEFELNDYLTDPNNISSNILQYCGLATFTYTAPTPVSTPEAQPASTGKYRPPAMRVLEFVNDRLITFLIPHILRTRREVNMWKSQYDNIINKINTISLRENNNVYMIGDFNIRGSCNWRDLTPVNSDWRTPRLYISNEYIKEIEGENTLHTSNITNPVNLEQYYHNGTHLSAHKIISANAKNIILNRIEYTKPLRDSGTSWRNPRADSGTSWRSPRADSGTSWRSPRDTS